MKKFIVDVKSFFFTVGEFLKKILTCIKNAIKPIITKIMRYSGLAFLAKKLRLLPNKVKQAIYGLLFIMPWLIGLGLIGIPLLSKSIRMALSDKYYFIAGVGWQITGTWSDFTQFKRIITSEPYHLTQILNTINDISLVVPLVVVFALILALMLNQKVKARAIFRTIFFIPVILLSGNLLAGFQSNQLLTVPAIASGAISSILSDYFPQVFSEIVASAFEKIVLILWLSGVQILIFLAGLQKMDKSMYEAAEIDGASMWELFWKITLPALIPLLYINIIYTTIVYSNLSNNAIVQIINVSSDQNRSLAGTLVDEVNYGRAYSAALSWILFTIELLVIGGYSLMVKLASKRYS
ncbi:MAG: sugar ABC transporter permease [Candidatus Izemoplasmatales bacterium]|nr:sugar ABC transporter permease [bacterium]MDZ4197253.1 sugar ABC transporter permease [Candidatus Izemoplasmatales bacterium]